MTSQTCSKRADSSTGRDSDMSAAVKSDRRLQSFTTYLLYRITNQLNQRLRGRLRKEGINISRWRVLAMLHAYGELALGEIVDLTIMEQSSVSRIVIRLEQEGLVRRKVSRKDSRFVHVILTAAGEKTFQSIYPTADRHQERALRGFSRNEIDTLTEFIRRMQSNIEAEE